MENKNIYLLSLAVVGLAMIGFMSLSGQTEDNSSNSFDFNNTSNFQRTGSGTKYLIHPDKLLTGCPGMDCIPSIDDPKYVGSSEADYLKPEDRVIGLEINGESRAYPLKILSSHEIVNDRVGGKPVAVTYCPLCRSGLTYSRKVDNQTLEFGVSGKLYKANLIMYDRKTETYWNQIQGKAVVGPLVPKKLDLVYSSVTNWSEWKEGHPDTKVLSRDTGIYPPSSYTGNQYAGYKESEKVGFGVNEADDRLPSKELVYGVKANGESKAYTENALNEENIIRDNLGNRSIVIFKDPSDGTVKAYITEKEGENTSVSLEEKGLQSSEAEISELESLNPKGFYWFAWEKFNPDTELYKLQNKN